MHQPNDVQPTPPLTAKFWKKVKKTETCWNWTGAQCRGYGRLLIQQPIGISAHRYSWILHHMENIPRGLVICHSCDNPSCVRPDHLFLGTQQDNVRDKVTKGRHYIRKMACNATLNTEQITEIRSSYKPRVNTQNMLAKKYGVSRENIHYILHGKSWSHIPLGNSPMDFRDILTKEQKEEIKSLKGQFPSRYLAKKFGVGKNTIQRLWRGYH